MRPVAIGIVVLGFVSVLVSMVVVLTPQVSEPHRRSRAVDNIRTMITMMISRRTEMVRGGYPPYTGRNFVLSLVATHQLDRRDPRNLEVLFPPSMRAQFEALDPSEYEQVTLESLKTKRFPHLTGYAGRATPITADEERMGTPLIADLTHPDGVIIGWTNGSVRLMEWEELDMYPPDGPVVVGPKAQHPLLRMLSDL